MATFFSYNALVSQRASGYKNTTYALAELIDNSFDANASTVRIMLLERRVENRKRVEQVLVLDDGDGMAPAVLQGALQFGNTTNADLDQVVKSRKKGKFGYGLPNASLSQSPSVHVYSWQKKTEKIPYVYLDLEELSKANSIDIPPVTQQSFPLEYDFVLPSLTATGTLVCWKRCDRLSHAKGETIIDNSLAPLGRLYRYLLSAGKKIVFSVHLFDPKKNQYIQTVAPRLTIPNDPLFLMSDTQLAPVLWRESQDPTNERRAESYKPFAISQKECKPTNVRLSDKCFPYEFEWLGRTYRFEIVTSVADLRIQKPGMREGGQTAVGHEYGRKERDGNISFVRADREIAAGGFGFYKATDARHRWWSVEVKFNADADDLLGVHNNKQGIEFVYTAHSTYEGEDEFNKYTATLLQAREHLWEELTKRIEDARKEAFKQIKNAHAKWDSEHPTGPAGGGGENAQVPKGTDTTTTVIKKVDGPRPATLPEAKRLELIARLQEKYSDIPHEEIVAAVTALDKALVRACVLYAPTESHNLWSYTRVYDFLVVLINTRHEFYMRVLSELRAHDQEGALAAMELFISSLAIEEDRISTHPDKAETVEEFRTLVGVHLHNYIRRFPDGLSVGAESAGSQEDED